MKILHVVAGLGVKGGGISELVPQLALAEARLGHEVLIATRAGTDEDLSLSSEEAVRGGVRVIRFTPSFPGFVYFSWRMLCGLAALVKRVDAVHVHGNWTFPVWFACRCAIRNGRTLVMSPQGSFDPVRLAYSAWKKKLVSGLDRRYLRRANLIHATAVSEKDWILSFCGTGVSEKIIIIPNGVVFPPQTVTPPRTGTERFLVSLGRLHPLKGLDLLLAAWQRCPEAVRNGWRLVIAGPDEQGTLAKLRQQVRTLGLESSVRFQGPVYGMEKWGLLRRADGFILPTKSENFGIVVAEALACGTPVICTKGAPWEGLVTQACGWWCDVSVTALADAIRAMTVLTDEARYTMGVRGRDWVYRAFDWNEIGRAQIDALKKTIGRTVR